MLAAAALFLRASGEIAQAKIPSRPVQAVAGGEFQPLHGKRIAITQAAAQPPFQLLQRQRLRPVLPLHGKCLNRHIGHRAYRLATLHIHPGTHSPLALLQLPALRGQVLGQLGQVNMRKVKKGPATPAVHPSCVHRQQRLFEMAHHRKALPPVLGRCGIQPQRMRPALFAQHQIHLVQGQGRRGQHFIHPLQATMPDGNFRL